MHGGRFLEVLLAASPTDFCIGAAGYPEKHFEAPNLAADVARVRQKVDAGAEYIVTQMFFDNAHYFAFVDECRSQGIDVPIIPGLRILTKPSQLTSIPRTFHCEIPQALADDIARSPSHARDIGVAWATGQAQELLAYGVPSIHFFVMSRSGAVNSVLAKLGL
jgi:methylenetetrahydrofolate reductase (NADPH)